MNNPKKGDKIKIHAYLSLQYILVLTSDLGYG